jgi:hypothetical protein
MRSVTGHRLGLKRLDRGADARGVLTVHLGEECKLPLDDGIGHSLHGCGVIREEPLLLLAGEQAKERAGLRKVVVACTMVVAARIAGDAQRRLGNASLIFRILFALQVKLYRGSDDR